MRTQRKKYSRLWVYLLYLGLVSSLILSVTLAKYASSVSGQGTATVAAMAGGGEPIQMTLSSLAPGGEPQVLKFKVVNYKDGKISEVALDYDVKVETTGNLPLVYTLTVEGTGNDVKDELILTDGSKAQTVSGAFDLDGKEQTHTYTLTANWPTVVDSGKETGVRVDDAGYADEIDLVTVTVEVRQRLSGDKKVNA